MFYLKHEQLTNVTSAVRATHTFTNAGFLRTHINQSNSDRLTSFCFVKKKFKKKCQVAFLLCDILKKSILSVEEGSSLQPIWAAEELIKQKLDLMNTSSTCVKLKVTDTAQADYYF